jgi:hypothetical protein
MARGADFDLATELGKPSFTPSQRDAAALVELVVAGEDPSAERAATALAGLGDAGHRAIAARLAGATAHADEDASEPPCHRSERSGLGAGALGDGERSGLGAGALGDGATARLVAALGLLARRGDGDARSAVIARTQDKVVRVRRAAILALGKLTGDVDGARAALLARWDAADVTPDERRALAEALGKLGGDAVLARLRALDPGSDAELARRRDRAVLIADRTARRGDESSVATDVDPSDALLVRLRCKRGLVPLLVEEARAHGFESSDAIGDDTVELRLPRALSALFALRLWERAEICFPMSGSPDDPIAIVEAVTRPPVRAFLNTFTRGPIRWRLGFAQGHKRAIIWRVAKEVATRAPELINDPTQTTWDVAADDRYIILSPRRIDDPRFAWRVADIPAASHPTVAAALAYVGEARHGDRVWDPFVGSGGELIERTRLGTYASLLGTDLDDAALAAARQNLAAARVDAKLVNADARTYDPGDIDLIVTNPPLGSRVKLDAAALLVACLPSFARALAPGGRLVWITPAPKQTTKVAEQLGLRRTRSLPVDLGGVRGHLERWER